MTLDPDITKSMAPPIPLIFFPGIIQLAISHVEEIYIAPSIVTSKWPPLITPKDPELQTTDDPGNNFIVSLLALITSQCSSPFLGYPPTPTIPFSAYNIIVLFLGT